MDSCTPNNSKWAREKGVISQGVNRAVALTASKKVPLDVSLVYLEVASEHLVLLAVSLLSL
jgi:hypothetical protein